MERDKTHEKQTLQRIRVVFKGEVQGVGFRYTLRHLAGKYRLSGWVKNMSDGYTVLAEIQGPVEQIEVLLREIERQFSIEAVQKEPVQLAEPENGFSIMS